MNIKQTQKGFTLIELMIVIAIIGILAAVALPAYSDYTQRAKMSEVILAGAGCRTELTEHISINGGPSASAALDFTCASASASSTSPYVKSVSVAATTGIVTLTSQGINSAATAGGAVVTLTPTTNAAGAAVNTTASAIYAWTCTSNAPAIMPSTCKGTT
ncbi:MAG: Fimbrial protein [Porticoccaceae bacterium UBA1117]|nr:MAG: Fimbrial protein [Porticoccaceae bacterium UBA1117]